MKKYSAKKATSSIVFAIIVVISSITFICLYHFQLSLKVVLTVSILSYFIGVYIPSIKKCLKTEAILTIEMLIVNQDKEQQSVQWDKIEGLQYNKFLIFNKMERMVVEYGNEKIYIHNGFCNYKELWTDIITEARKRNPQLPVSKKLLERTGIME